MPVIKKKYILWYIIVNVFFFVVPFLIKESSDSYNFVLSTSFGIIESFAAVGTLIVAIALFDKFGINAKFKENQILKVIELANHLTALRIDIAANGMKYLYHVLKPASWLEELDEYKLDGKNIVLLSDNFTHQLQDFYSIMYNQWLPKEIKMKMKFLDLGLMIDVADPMDLQYARITLNRRPAERWVKTFPILTVEMIVNNFHELFEVCENWITKYADIPVNLRSDFPESYQ